MKAVSKEQSLKIVRSSAQLGLYVKLKRKSLGLTQTVLAQNAGIAQQTLSEFESDPSKARIETAFQILLALETQMRLLDDLDN